MEKRKPIYSRQEALKRLMDFCSRTEKSPYEIEAKLKQWGLENHASEIVGILMKENFINRSRFVLSFSKDKMSFNKWGKLKIRYQLKAHHISDQEIDLAFAQINQDNYEKMIFTELEKKRASLKTKNVFQKKAKLYSFGTQRGYEPEVMHRFFNTQGL